ncbi:MAG: Triostin synthetase I [Syntrophus sp. SKADARSKE-3]|nr:Triostin synthetase I [Syntrophus sp. SKADARSKE-3]
MEKNVSSEDHKTGANQNTDAAWYKKQLAPPAEPDRPFILNGETYGDIHRLAGGLYHYTTSSGICRPWICLCTEDKSLIMAALLAALAGGPRLILPYAHSCQALSEVCEAAGPAFFLTKGEGGDDYPPGPAVITPFDFPVGKALPDGQCDPDEPFLTLFTGGSTGMPKMWPKTPRNMFGEARYQTDALNVSPDDLFLSTVPPNHIYGLLFTVLVPFIGRACVLGSIFTFPREILKAAKTFRATILVSIPVHYRILNTDSLHGNYLRAALSSAGMLDKDDALAFRQKTGVDVLEVYGSTETGGIATRRHFVDGDTWVPMDPITWEIQEGVLRVRSAFLSPELPRDSHGYFMTADCVDKAEDNRFILRGRADDIVKIGGKRVNILAVQAKLCQLPDVRDAVVISRPAGQGRQNELAALVVANSDVILLRRLLAEISEAYAIPKHIVTVDRIPMTPAGKYDRAEIERLLKVEKKQ